MAGVYLSMQKKFDGETYDEELDCERLSTQMERIRHFMLSSTGPGWLDGRWSTAEEVASACRLTLTAGTSTRLRDLRKARFGGFNVEIRRRAFFDGLWEYRVHGKLGGLEPSLSGVVKAVAEIKAAIPPKRRSPELVALLRRLDKRRASPDPAQLAFDDMWMFGE